jgi:hypothetical protein
MHYPKRLKLLLTRVLPIVWLDIVAIDGVKHISFGSGGSNSFEHQDNFLSLNK